ncbi:hypothetical protein B0H13DRAFT_2291642 [Mycena leptocephala]|nr:hypothetical protein B0H13DRAFT_2291642 [Mycena leptocephala]
MAGPDNFQLQPEDRNRRRVQFLGSHTHERSVLRRLPSPPPPYSLNWDPQNLQVELEDILEMEIGKHIKIAVREEVISRLWFSTILAATFGASFCDVDISQPMHFSLFRIEDRTSPGHRRVTAGKPAGILLGYLTRESGYVGIARIRVWVSVKFSPSSLRLKAPHNPRGGVARPGQHANAAVPLIEACH